MASLCSSASAPGGLRVFFWAWFCARVLASVCFLILHVLLVCVCVCVLSGVCVCVFNGVSVLFVLLFWFMV